MDALCLLERSHQVKRLLHHLLLHTGLSTCFVVFLEELKQVLLLHWQGTYTLEGELGRNAFLFNYLFLYIGDILHSHILHGHQ